MSEKPLLEVDNLKASIGQFHVLEDVSLSVFEGSATVILGRNGAGKTTTLRTVLGFVSPHSGSARFDGRSIVGADPFVVARLGISYVPENRGVFNQLTVADNLRLADAGRSDRSEVLELFPILHDRLEQRAGQLSGGQQQMLAIARALLMKPRLLVLDEPTKGIAPMVVNEIMDTLYSLKERLTILLVEQNLAAAQRLCDDFVVIDEGVSVAAGRTAELGEGSDVVERYLTLSGAGS